MKRLSLSLLALAALVALAAPAEASGRRGSVVVRRQAVVVQRAAVVAHGHNAVVVNKVIAAPVVVPFVTSALVVNPIQAFANVGAVSPLVIGGVSGVSVPPADVGLLREQNELLRQQNAQLRQLQLQVPRQ